MMSFRLSDDVMMFAYSLRPIHNECCILYVEICIIILPYIFLSLYDGFVAF